MSETHIAYKLVSPDWTTLGGTKWVVSFIAPPKQSPCPMKIVWR